MKYEVKGQGVQTLDITSSLSEAKGTFDACTCDAELFVLRNNGSKELLYTKKGTYQTNYLHLMRDTIKGEKRSKK